MKVSELLKKYRTERLPLVTPNTRKSDSGSVDRICEFFVDRKGDPGVEDVRRGYVVEFLT